MYLSIGYAVVLGISCLLQWTDTSRGIEVGKLKGYRYDLEYKLLGEYIEPLKDLLWP